ncbi:MAG: cobalt ECF transporter T component CbiQ [Chloroflexi bacterium]|nr:MAG: cobalt ECF transporter T component CbiQ [Chloroflexota bacterium]
MLTNKFDPYQHRNSSIHKLDPRVKVVITLLFIVANVLLPDGAWSGYMVAWGMVLLIAFRAQISVRLMLKRSLIILPFMLAAVTVMFSLPGEPIWTWHLGNQVVTISDAGLIRFLSILVRSWLSVQMAILLTMTTQFPDLMHALSHLRVPAILVTIIAFMYRYLFVLVEEAMRLLRAREARSARMDDSAGGGSLWWRAKITGNMIGQLLVRSLDRSDRVYQAMVSRGYDGRFLTLNPHQMERHDWVLAGVALGGIVLIQIIGRIM